MNLRVDVEEAIKKAGDLCFGEVEFAVVDKLIRPHAERANRNADIADAWEELARARHAYGDDGDPIEIDEIRVNDALARLRDLGVEP